MRRTIILIHAAWIVIGITATAMTLVWLNSKCAGTMWSSDSSPGLPMPNVDGKGHSGHETKLFGVVIDAKYQYQDHAVVISQMGIYYKCWWAIFATGVALTLLPLLIERIVFHWHQRKRTEAKPANLI